VLGCGLGLSFPILSAAALSSIGRENMGYATSLYNMTRNTGAAIGIAWLTDMLVRNQQIHQSFLVQHFSVFDAWRMSNMDAGARALPPLHFVDQMVTGQKQGLGIVYHLIQQQAAMLAFNDIYRMLAVIAVITIPSFVLFRAAKPTRAHVTAH
jgi:DHA2 family multidrug resistance protein